MQRKIHQAIRSALLLALATLTSAPGAGAPATCVKVTSEAIYRSFGYDHIVHVANGCTASVACAVTTDVNPEATSVTVAAGERADVLTFRGSPARTFKPRADCHFTH